MRRLALAGIVVGMLVFAPAAIPSVAQETSLGPRLITGTYQTTNPIYPTIGAQTGVVLYDLSGQIQRDFDFQPAEDTQVLGTLQGDIARGQYTIALPPVPNGQCLDFDGDPASPPAVQVFAPSVFIEFRGDEHMNRGETPLALSAQLEPLTFDIIGGHILVWSASKGELFPAGFGPDGAAFTADDPLMPLPAGWSVVSLASEPFTISREAHADLPIVESFGGLNDYSAMSYLDAWETLYQRTAVTYPFTAEKKLDWEAIYQQITPAIQQAGSDLEFHLAITRLGDLIPDTHIGYVSVPIMQTFLFGGVGVRRLSVTDDGQVVVVEVAPRSAASQAGLQQGDILLTVDGIPALQALDETPLLLTSASTPHGRRYLQAATLLQGPLGSQVTLTWQSSGGVERSATLTRTADVGALLEAFSGGLSGDVVEAQVLPSGLGYLRVRSFAQEVSQADDYFAAALQMLLDAGVPGIILDVRDNSGGLVQLAMDMAGHFVPGYERLFNFYYADGTGDFVYRGFVETLPGEPYYDGPLAVLVNEMTGSAGDLFVYALHRNGRAIVVGETPTGGFAGEVGDGQYLLPGGLNLQIPTGRPMDPLSGTTLIEGEGIAPDVRVPRTWKSVLSPEDEVLQAAESALLGDR